MNFTLEQIDVLRQRANVSYEEAKEALEKSNGDMVEAMIYLEKNNKVKKGHCHSHCHGENGFINTVKNLVKKGQETKFVMKKDDKTVIDVPVNALVLTTAVAAPVTIGGVVVGLFTNHKIKFVKPDGGDMEVNKVFDKVSSAVSNININKDISAK